MISNDKRIYDAGSEPAKRMAILGERTDGLKILILGLGGKSIFLSQKVEISPAGRNKLFSVINALIIARQLNKRSQPIADVVTVQDPFLAGLAGFLIKKALKIKLQIQIHTDIMSSYFEKESLANRLRYQLALFLIPRSDCIRVVSGRIKDSLIQKFPRLKISVLSIFIDIEKIKRTEPRIDLRQKYPQYNFIILMASRFTREKNINLAISAMAEIVKKHPRTGLVIVGHGPLEGEYILQIRDLGLGQNVKIEPWSEDIISYYKTADLFLLTSDYEGYGLTLAEAVISGCPVVSTNVGAAGEIIKDGQNGFIIKVGGKTALVQAILKLIENKGLHVQMKHNNLSTNPFPYSSAQSYFESYVKLLKQQ